MIRHIGQRHIISLQKGKSCVIILKIKSFTHSRRHLINKTKYALIPAMSVLIHQSVLKFDPQIFLWILIHFQQPLFPVSFLYQDFNVGFLNQELIVKHILYLFTVYGNQPVPLLNSQFLRDALRQYFLYNMTVHLYLLSYHTRNSLTCH